MLPQAERIGRSIAHPAPVPGHARQPTSTRVCSSLANACKVTAESTAPALSVVIPVYNEEDVLQALFDRLYPALDALGEPYEIIFVNDGSRDRSAQLLRRAVPPRPDVTRVILFNGNFGQHMAIMAGFEHVRGAHRDHPRRRPAEPARGDPAPGRRGARGPRLRRHRSARSARTPSSAASRRA